MKNNQEVKDLVNGIVKMLQEKGVNVTDAAFVKVGDQQGVEDIINKALEEVGVERLDLGKQEVDEGPCFCPECFNFETFESVLAGTGGIFDKKTIQLGDKEFEIKYYNGKYGERIMMQEYQWKVPEDWSKDQLELYLNSAVKNREFDKAQLILNALNNKK